MTEKVDPGQLCYEHTNDQSRLLALVFMSPDADLLCVEMIANTIELRPFVFWSSK
jgi:hypothetical protein